MKILCLSDSHGSLPELDLDGIDLVLHAGDYSLAGKFDWERQIQYFEQCFCPWIKKISNSVAVYYIDGNHETYREFIPTYTNDVIENYNINNRKVIFKGKSIYGFPYTPYFYGWAYNLFDIPDQLGQQCNNIPDNTNILLSHGPPHGVLDHVMEKPAMYKNAGSKELARRIDQINPELMIFGHLHINFGIIKKEKTTYVGCSLADEDYLFNRQPIVLEI